jgi:hypothetical protein
MLCIWKHIGPLPMHTTLHTVLLKSRHYFVFHSKYWKTVSSFLSLDSWKWTSNGEYSLSNISLHILSSYLLLLQYEKQQLFWIWLSKLLFNCATEVDNNGPSKNLQVFGTFHPLLFSVYETTGTNGICTNSTGLAVLEESIKAGPMLV